MKSKEKGITLIALAITIIVLLILAGISITSLISDKGILKQTQTAADKNKIQEYKQELTLALLEGQLEIADTKSPSDVDYAEQLRTKVMGKIDNKFTIEVKTENILCTATIGEYKYTVTTTEVIYGDVGSGGGTVGSTGTWTQDRVYVKNGKIKLEVGSEIIGYSVTVDKSTYGKGKWYVLGAKDGKLLITTNVNVATPYLSGKNGYTDGIVTLNTEAAKYTNSDYAEGSARAINVDDINRVTGYDPDAAQFNSGDNVDQWKNEVIYTKSPDDGYIYYYGTKYPSKAKETIGTKSKYNKFTYWTGSEWKTLDSGESSPPIKHTYYIYNPQTLTTKPSTSTRINGSSKAYGLLFPSGSGYWLATQFVKTEDACIVGMFCAYNGSVHGRDKFYSYRYDGRIKNWSEASSNT